MPKNYKYYIIVILVSFLLPLFLPAQVKRPLMKDSRDELARIMAADYNIISLAIATFEGKVNPVVKEVKRLGGEVRYRSDELGYLRINVPIHNVMKLMSFPDIEAIMINTAYLGEDGSANSIQTVSRQARSIHAKTDTSRTSWPPVLSDYPLENPYHPWEDLDVTNFIKENPTFDGRGTVIGLIESFPDILLPELQWSLDKNGNKVRKIIDQINVSDPLDARLIGNNNLKNKKIAFRNNYRYTRDLRWVDMKTEVKVKEGKVIFNDTVYIINGKGKYRIGLLTLGKGLKRLLKGIDVKIDSTGQMAVLWDEESDKVWVDTNSDYDFSDETALKEYKLNQEYGLWGKDDPATAIRESIAFTVQIDRKNKFISINDCIGSHVTMVAGSAVANDAFGGKVKGVAPNAQLIPISYAYGSTKSYYIESLIVAFTDDRIDVVLIESYTPQSAGVYDLRDGTSVIDIIHERILKKYPKPCVVTGGNTAGLTQIGNNTVGERLMCIGGYQSKEAILTNFAVKGAPRDDIHAASAYGPAGNGLLKPDLLSPSYIITLTPGFTLEKGTLHSLYRLPPGYERGGGTSQATPVAAGAIALLVSAIKQSDMAIKPQYIKNSLASTARYISNLQAHQQGNGLIQVGSAWENLQKLEKYVPPIKIKVEADVKTVCSHLNATPHKGLGLFEQEGWKKGMSGERTLTFIRTSGSAKPISFNIIWQGNNDSTFTGKEKIVLPLNKAVSYPVQITAKDYGVHSALLILDHPDYPGQECKLMATIVVPEKFQRSDNYAIVKKEMLRRPNGRLNYFINIPEGTEHLSAEIQSTNKELVLTLHPPDKSFIHNSWTMIYGYSDYKRVNLSHPIPGNWEVVIKEFPYPNGYADFLESLGDSLPDVSVTTKFNIYNTSFGKNTLDFKDKKQGSDLFKYVNKSSAFKGKVYGSAIGVQRKVKKKIAENELHIYEVKIDTGTTALLVDLNINIDTDADLDVLVLDPGGRDALTGKYYAGYDYSGFGKSYSGSEAISIDNPTPGSWKIIIDGFLIPQGNIEYTYSDIIQHPKYGFVSTSDIIKERKMGESWPINAHLWLNEKSSDDRKAVGVLRVERITDDAKKKPVLIKREIIQLE